MNRHTGIRMSFIVGLMALLFGMLLSAPASADNCRDCHSDEAYMVKNKRVFDYFQKYEDSLHDAAGVECSDCHGGNVKASTAEEAHKGVKAKVDYKEIPETCGSCHETQLESFRESRHFALLESQANAPNCVTCHNSHEADIYYTTIVANTCVSCHNPKQGLAVDVPERTNHILNRINIINGYMAYVQKYFHGEELLTEIHSSHGRLVKSWHTFDLDTVEAETEELLRLLRRAKKIAREDRKH